MEIWKDIKGFESLYQASNTGLIKRKQGYQCKKDRILKQVNNGFNYMSVSLSEGSTVKRFYVHRLIAETFLENNQNKEEVNHIDGDRQNNELSNLEWVTRSENHYHRYKVLKQRGVNFGKTGDKNWRSKPVICFDKEGNFIKRYAGVMEAMRQTGIHEANIRGAIHGRSKSSGGYIWNYEINPARVQKATKQTTL